MERRRLSSGSPFEERAGYCRALVAGSWCFVSGTTGYDYATMVMPESAADQTRQALRTIDNVLDEAGFSRADIVRVQYTVTDRTHVDAVFDVTGPWFSDNPPAATMVIAGLIEARMKVEIEVTAFRG